MKFTRRSARVWHGLTTAGCCLLTVMLGGTAVAGTLETRINSMLGTRSSKVVTVQSGEEEDTTYFKSDFETAQEVVDYREDLNRRIEAEGSVLLKNENSALPL